MESPALEEQPRLQKKQGVGLEGFLRGWVDPSGLNLRLRSPSVLRQLQTSLTKKETRNEGVEEGRVEKCARSGPGVTGPNLLSFRLR